MKKILLLVTSISVLGCSTVPKVTNLQELDAHAEVMLRYGVKDKEECRFWYMKCKSKFFYMKGKDKITTDATEPINIVAIERYYKKLANKDPYSDIRQMYNQDVIDKTKYRQLKANRREELIARIQLYLALSQSMQTVNSSYQSTPQNTSSYTSQKASSHNSVSTVSAQPFALTPTLEVKDSYGQTQQTIKKNPFALNETYDIYEGGRKVGTYEKQPFSLNKTWKLKDSSGRTISSTTEQPFSLNETWRTTDSSGQLKYKTEEQPFSLTPTYKTYDSSGKQLNTIQKKPFSLNETWEIK